MERYLARFKNNESIKISTWLKPDEITFDDIEYVHDGWLELAVGKNNASKEEYLEAAKLLIKYISKAEENNCFPKGIGMGFFVGTKEDDYKVRLWCINGSSGRSGAYDVGDFRYDGHFLRIA